MSAATGSTAGAAGLVPAPQAGAQDKFLRGDGTWVDLFSEYDAMVFKGIVIQDSDLPTSGYSAGWTYRAAADGIYKGEYCEVGDLIIAVNDYDSSTASNADWTKIEHNIDGALFMGHAGSALSDGTKLLNVTGGGVVTTSSSTVGSLTKPVFLNAGTLTETTHSLNATINSGTANQVAYYSDANTIDSMAPAWQPWTAGSTNGPQANIQIGNAIYQSAAIPSATATDSGIVTTVAQTFAGDKTFQGNVFPAVSDSYNLGSTALRWKFLYGVRGIDLTNTGATGITINNTDIAHSSSYKIDAAGLAGIYDDSHTFWVLSTDQPYGDTWLKSKANRNIIFERNGTENARFDTTGHFIPGTTETYNLGSTTKYWNNAYIKNIIYSSGEANRLVWTDSDKLLKATNHYADATSIAINSTTIPTPPTDYPTYNLYINGDARSSGDLYFEGTNNRLAAFKLTTVGTVSRANIDMGWDWEKLDGAGAAFRSTDPNLAANQIGRFVLFARTTADDTAQLVGAPTGELSWKKASGAARIGINADANANYNLYVNGNTKIESSPAADTPLVTFVSNTTPSTDGYQHGLHYLVPNMVSDSNAALYFGKAASTGNAACLQMNWVENNHNNNFFGLGFWGVNNLLRIYKTGNVSIGEANNTYKLYVAGDMYTSGWARAASGFYCHDTGVHYTHNGNHGEINITKSNEMIISGNANTLYINYRAASRGTLVTTFRFHGGSSTTYAKLVTGGLDVWGHVAADTGTAGYGANSGGGYHNAYNNIILHGHDTSGSSGILFISGKGTTTINQPSDRAFIQFHPYGVTAAAEGTAPTIGTSGENNRLVIGVGNDATDQIWLQAPAHTGLIHQLGATSCVIPDTGNATGTVGSATVPVYVNGGVITQGSYALGSTVNAGTANYMAYYSGANAISATSGARISTNTNLSIWPSGSSPNYSHGIRIHSLSSWSGILFCGDDQTTDVGTSANSWWFGNNNGNFYITRNGSTAVGSATLRCVNNKWYFNTTSGSEHLNVGGWVGTVGSTGWYNITYGGGWYMNDSTWIRSYNNKSVYTGSGTIRSDNVVWGNKVTLQGDWVGFYSAAGTGTRYGYVQANANRMYFRKENGVSSYHFDFNGHLYTTGTYYTTAQPGVYVTVSSGKWAYVRLHNSSAYWDIATNNAASGTAPANSLGFRYNGGNPSAAAGVWITPAQVLMGAAWNDYAEYRETKEEIEPGRCVKEIGDDTLEITTKRLERGCEIVSDTYGFVIGKTEKCQTPIASSGRVLAYGYESREEFASHIGWPVCSGPDGTVSIMTEEEEEKYPSRIIGTISAVPDYEEWGTGNVKVNGRVWIRIR